MMTVHRTGASKTHESIEIPALSPWQHSWTPSEGAIPRSFASEVKSRSRLMQLALICLLLTYICLPSHAVRRISSKASLQSVSNTGRIVFHSLSEILNGFSTDLSGERGVTIVAACMNRQDTLAKVLPTWLSVPGVDEVVLVDWSSDPPLRSIVQLQKEPRLKLYRVNGEKSWVLSRAFNLAFNKTSKDYIIRIDCDYALDGAILEAHNLNATETGFYSGNWMLARDGNEVHLNGAMVIKKDVFWSVGGYDERIQTYGWDDEDLYTRLTANNFQRLNVSYDHVTHISHGDGSRAQRGVKFAQVQIDLNQLLLENLPQWSRNMFDTGESSTYRIVQAEEDAYVELEATYVPTAIRNHVNPRVYLESWALALGRRLADDYHIPWDILGSMDSANKELLLRSLMALQNDLDEEVDEHARRNNSAVEKTLLPTHARTLFVHCMHGLGNRLRALGSALAFARNSRRVPVIIWEGDAHISAEFRNLFNVSELIVLDRFIPTWPFTDLQAQDPSWQHFDYYNYMEMEEGANKGELIVNNPKKHLYYKGAYVMEAPGFSWWEAENDELQRLMPIGMVQAHLKNLRSRGLSTTIGVHIRNRTLATDIEHLNVEEEYGIEAAAKMNHWRTKSTYRTFVEEMQRIIKEEDPGSRFYVASDSYEIIPIMKRKFPGRILCTKRTCDDRNSECVKYALIDLYALSHTKQLLGSNWSSYTEIVERLGGLTARLAGQDFGGNLGTSVGEALGKDDVLKSEEELKVEDQDRQNDSRRE